MKLTLLMQRITLIYYVRIFPQVSEVSLTWTKRFDVRFNVDGNLSPTLNLLYEEILYNLILTFNLFNPYLPTTAFSYCMQVRPCRS